jgi:hypothetical protein
MNGNNQNNMCDEETLWKRKRGYLEDKMQKLETNSIKKNIRDLYRGVTEFKKGHYPDT